MTRTEEPRTVSELPVYLLTGFLGSGKTTLLSRLVRSTAFADTAVIINEFGQVGLDHLLLGRARDDDTVLLDSGCLCCAMNSSLQDSLESLYYRRLRAELPPFSRIVVETSGLADPAPLINTLAADPSVSRHYRFGGVIATVDAMHGLDSMESYREACTQVALADVLIITKTDLCTPAQIEVLRGELTRCNATAAIRLATAEHSDGEDSFFDGFETGRSAAVCAALASESSGVAPGPHTPAFRRLSHVLRYGIASYVLRTTRPVTWRNYAEWVRHLQQHGGARILRVKAILDFDDGFTYAIHGVRHLFSPPTAVTYPVPPAQRGAIVVITQEMAADELVQSLSVLEPDPRGRAAS